MTTLQVLDADASQVMLIAVMAPGMGLNLVQHVAQHIRMIDAFEQAEQSRMCTRSPGC